jgi:hypothetical protein
MGYRPVKIFFIFLFLGRGGAGRYFPNPERHALKMAAKAAMVDATAAVFAILRFCASLLFPIRGKRLPLCFCGAYFGKCDERRNKFRFLI